MRLLKIKTLAVALTGVAMFASEAAQAGDQTNCGVCAAHPESARIRGPHNHSTKTKKKTGHICADCAAKMQANAMISPSLAANAPSGCASCGTTGSTSAPTYASASGSAPTYASASGSAPTYASAPGYASIGDGSPGPLLAAGGSAPGYAIVGGTMVSSEPTPIGVMQTNYRAEGSGMPQGTPGASVANNRGGAPGMSGIPSARPDEVPPSLYASPKRRGSVLARMIGLPDFGRRRAEMETRQRENHAMTSYGATSGMPSELPASVVYGGR